MNVRCPSMSSGLSLGLTLIMMLMVISSPIVILVNPALANAASASASAPSTLPTISTIPSAPSTIGQDGREGDFTAQAALGGLTVRPTNDIVGTKAFYDIVFLTTTSGSIKTVVIGFPGSTGVPTSAFLNEVEGLGPGTVTKSGNVLRYTVNDPTPPVIPAGTKIRLEYANIINPGVPGSYVVTGSTRDVNNNFIDGPTQSVPYPIKQKGASAIANNAITTPKIADNSITSTKPAESFMKKVILLDNPEGNARGWNPNGNNIGFAISGETLTDDTMITINVNSVDVASFCGVSDFSIPLQIFSVSCNERPANGAVLHYLVQNVPAHIP